MPISSINAGIASSQPSLKGAMAQRAYQQELPSATTPTIADASQSTSPQEKGASPGNVFSTAPIGSQTGIAAYVAIMNQSTSSSMRIEA